MFTLVEIPPGASIVDVARSMVAVSQKKQETTRAEFQGIRLEANPETSAEEIVFFYFSQHEGIRNRQQATETLRLAQLTDKKIRKGEIALLLMRRYFKKEGVRLTPNFLREVGNMANEIRVPHEELTQFMESIVRELVDEVFAPPEATQPPQYEHKLNSEPDLR